MAYLKKNIEALIDLKITDRGRQLISMAEFSDIEYFQIGDSEYDYNNRIIKERDESGQQQIVFRAKDKDSDIKYPVLLGPEQSSLSGTTYGIPFPNHIDEVVSQKVEFLGVTQHQNIKTPLGICIPLMNFDGSDVLVTGELISCEYIMVKFPQDPSNVLDTDGPCLWYKVVEFIDNQTIKVDRPLPDYSHITDITKEATVFQYSKRETTDYVDFNIAWTEEFAGYDLNLPRTYADGTRYTSTKELFGYTSHMNSDGLVVQKFIDDDTGDEWEYCSTFKDSYGNITEVYPDDQKFVGIIHYTKWEDYYGTGEWWKEEDVDFELNLPTLMYHRDETGVMGHKFTMGMDKKYVKSFVNDEMDENGDYYYDLLDTTLGKNVVGKVFPYKQVVVIDDEEILMALSMKSNRNWTLPAPKAVRISSDADCIDSPDDVLLPMDLSKEVYVSYMFYDDNNSTYSAPCAQYIKVEPKDDDNYDVTVSFKDGFGFLRDLDILDNDPGFQATKFFILVQQVDAGQKPTPEDWRYIEYTDSLVNYVSGSNIVSSNIVGKKYIITAEDYDNADAFSYQDLIGYPNLDQKGNMIFGDEFMLMGDLTLHKQHSVYVMNYVINLPKDLFVRSQNPTWDNGNLRITEVALYNRNKEMVAIGKLSIPHIREVGSSSSEQVISVKIDF
jgi:hypothetical protein